MNKSKFYTHMHVSPHKIKKNFVTILLVLCLLACFFSSAVIGSGAPPLPEVKNITPYPSTDKAVYLLDPYEWIHNDTNNYSGSYLNGHGRDVTLDGMLLD